MWITGIMSKKQAKELKKAGYEVNIIDELAFNRLLNPKGKYSESSRDIRKEDVLACIFTDADAYDELKKVIEEEKAYTERKRKDDLCKARVDLADETFAEADAELLEIPEDSEVVDSEGWEYDGDNTLIKKFYYSNPDGGDSLIGSFIVTFKNDSDRVIDVYSNIW